LHPRTQQFLQYRKLPSAVISMIAAMPRDIKRDTPYYMMHTVTTDGNTFSHHASREYGFVMFLFCMLYVVMVLVYSYTSQCVVYFSVAHKHNPCKLQYTSH